MSAQTVDADIVRYDSSELDSMFGILDFVVQGPETQHDLAGCVLGIIVGRHHAECDAESLGAQGGGYGLKLALFHERECVCPCVMYCSFALVTNLTPTVWS